MIMCCICDSVVVCFLDVYWVGNICCYVVFDLLYVDVIDAIVEWWIMCCEQFGLVLIEWQLVCRV